MLESRINSRTTVFLGWLIGACPDLCGGSWIPGIPTATVGSVGGELGFGDRLVSHTVAQVQFRVSDGSDKIKVMVFVRGERL